ncbi:MAG TPA: HD domain-containing phosphohydrolase [Gemmatimonadales bacterium]|nr:HD domain-containing phosphohydrolase [Gemmatimonadales bacterium]
MTDTATRLPRHSGTVPVADVLEEARAHERAGRLGDAIAGYAHAIVLGEETGDAALLAEALRRLGVVRHLRGEGDEARALCRRSHEVAVAARLAVPAAEALNTLAGFDLERGEYDRAREGFGRALALGGASAALRGRIEQNLGILANIRGDLAGALAHYERSLGAFRSAEDERGCAIAYHNLGMISADRRLWDDADRYFGAALAVADGLGDVHLRGLCLLNHTEVHLARRELEQARRNAEAALAIFGELGDLAGKAAAYRFLGVYYHAIGGAALAEARLRDAIRYAATSGAPLEEAEASRELARVCQELGRNQEALHLLSVAHRLFRRLDARRDAVDVGAKIAELEETYLGVVRTWGQSIESADSYTFGHCERVAEYAVTVARALGLDQRQQQTVRLGAYLHDIGKVRVPHEVLNKPGRLTPEEFDLVKQHPVWGVEMLATVEFPWDLKPIIRWHHERWDGTGYPDRLAGEEIPVNAQIICIVDVFDALTTTRSYKPALAGGAAVAQMRASRSWWRADVYDAFMGTIGQTLAA